jgi:hypothetical protein
MIYDHKYNLLNLVSRIILWWKITTCVWLLKLMILSFKYMVKSGMCLCLVVFKNIIVSDTYMHKIISLKCCMTLFVHRMRCHTWSPIWYCFKSTSVKSKNMLRYPSCYLCCNQCQSHVLVYMCFLRKGLYASLTKSNNDNINVSAIVISHFSNMRLSTKHKIHPLIPLIMILHIDLYAKQFVHLHWSSYK